MKNEEEIIKVSKLISGLLETHEVGIREGAEALWMCFVSTMILTGCSHKQFKDLLIGMGEEVECMWKIAKDGGHVK